MFDRIRHVLLRFLRVPAEPQPPLGAPGSVQVFRAGRNYFKLRLLRWGVTQIGAVIGILFSLWFLDQIHDEAAALRAAVRQAQVATPAATPAALVVDAPTLNPATTEPAPEPARPAKRKSSRKRDRNDLARVVSSWPEWIFPLLYVLEYGGIALFVLQIPVTLAATRLEFEQHWYIVTDRSLRIRTGIFHLTESTMSFANLQQVEVKQGPLQRLLGLADVRVQSAGGGGSHDEKHPGDSLHTGIFHSVENATEIRDLILTRLRQFRQAGLGDPDDATHAPSGLTDHAASPAGTSAPLDAALELLAEARALRAELRPRI